MQTCFHSESPMSYSSVLVKHAPKVHLLKVNTQLMVLFKADSQQGDFPSRVMLVLSLHFLLSFLFHFSPALWGAHFPPPHSLPLLCNTLTRDPEAPNHKDVDLL